MVDFLGIPISAEDIVNFLRQDLKFTVVCRQILSLRIIHEEAIARSIKVSEAELQTEGDTLRRQMRLESAEKRLNGCINSTSPRQNGRRVFTIIC
ncbi:MAG: hypothetical protein HC800_16075 [Phormidesmis sp. RL_2_1]|nr:hypothetical protein [Phormidesmis sp. RL_2_1]